MADAARVAALVDDLGAEHAALDAIVSAMDLAAWDRSTPAEGWTVRDQLSHLAWVDERAVEAMREPEVFLAGLDELLTSVPNDPMSVGVNQGRGMPAPDVLAWWRTARGAFLEAAAQLDPGARVVWYGPRMSVASFVTARLMETWAHGQDIVDALGVVRPPTDRLRHVAHIGVSARPCSFSAHGLEPPTAAVYVALRGPSGEEWTWGPPDAADSVAGDALDFCLVVIRRRHLNDTTLRVHGPVATQWMSLAQAYAGPPGSGRRPGQFAAVS